MNVIIKRWSKRTTPKLSVCAVQSVFALDKAAMTLVAFSSSTLRTISFIEKERACKSSDAKVPRIVTNARSYDITNELHLFRVKSGPQESTEA